MKQMFFCQLPACAALLLASCGSPAPVIVSSPTTAPSFVAPSSNSVPVPAVSTPASKPYPDIAGVWKTSHATITVGPTRDGSFSITFVNQGMPKPHVTTGNWGPLHRHFKFSSRKGKEVIATLNSQTEPTMITTDDQDGGNHIWRR